MTIKLSRLGWIAAAVFLAAIFVLVVLFGNVLREILS